MLRTALRPRWLAWLAVALAAVYVCVRLGLWQLGVAESSGQKEALEKVENRPVAPISQVVAPHQTWDARVMGNRRVTVTGTYERTGQFVVPQRRLDGVTGYWVVTPLRTTDPVGTLAVVRGWVPTATAPAPPTGPRTVHVSLAQGESPAEVGSAPLPDGQEPTIDLSRLVNEWDGPLYNAFGFAQSETPDAPLTDGLRRVPPPQPESGLQPRNFAYAIQWWIFGLFCPLLWWRMVRASVEGRADATTDVAPRPDATPDAAAEPATPPTGATSARTRTETPDRTPHTPGD